MAQDAKGVKQMKTLLTIILTLTVMTVVSVSNINVLAEPMRPRDEYVVFFAGGEQRSVFALSIDEALALANAQYGKLGTVHSVAQRAYVYSEWVGYDETLRDGAGSKDARDNRRP